MSHTLYTLLRSSGPAHIFAFLLVNLLQKVSCANAMQSFYIERSHQVERRLLRKACTEAQANLPHLNSTHDKASTACQGMSISYAIAEQNRCCLDCQTRQDSALIRLIMDTSREALDGDNSDGYIVVRKKEAEKASAASATKQSGPGTCCTAFQIVPE